MLPILMNVEMLNQKQMMMIIVNKTYRINYISELKCDWVPLLI